MASLFTFGAGALGELGTGRADDIKRLDAVAVTFPKVAEGCPIEDFALGVDHSVAVVGGRVYWWGLWGAHAAPETLRGGSAPLTLEVVPIPTSIAHLPGRSGGSEPARRDDQSAFADGRVRSVACGGSNSFLLTDDGEVFVLGSLRPPGGNPNGVRHLWGSPSAGPTCRVVSVAAGWRHCLLLTEAGQVFALGDDEHGQCAGVNTGSTSVSMPTAQGLAGIAAGACHSIAWDCAGAAFAWGHAGSGRLGLGQAQHRRSPARIEKLPEAVCMASCGANFTMFSTSSGHALWVCGGNQYGQLGLGAHDHSAREVPTRMDFPRGGEEVVSIACGSNHVLCMTRLSTTAGMPLQRAVVWAWGCASSGQLGRAESDTAGGHPTQARGVPEAITDFLVAGSDWSLRVAAGKGHSAVLAAPGGGAPLLSPVRKPPSPAKRRSAAEPDGKEDQDDDIIDLFCAGLATSLSQSPPHGDTSAFISPRVDVSNSSIVDETVTNAGYSPPRKRQGRLVATSAQRAGPTQTGRLGPKASPSWSNVGRRQTPASAVSRTSPQQMVSKSPSDTHSKSPVKAIRNDEGVTVSLGAHAGCVGTFYCGRFLGKDAIPDSDGRCGPNSGPQCSSCFRLQVSEATLPRASTQEPLLLGPAGQDDQWNGVHKMMQGLDSLIANIGASTVRHRSPVARAAAAQVSGETVHAGDSAAGGTVHAGNSAAHGSPRENASLSPSNGHSQPATGSSQWPRNGDRSGNDTESPSFLPPEATALSPGAPPRLHAEDRDDAGSDASLDFSVRSDDSNFRLMKAGGTSIAQGRGWKKEVVEQDRSSVHIDAPNRFVVRSNDRPADNSSSPMFRRSASGMSAGSSPRAMQQGGSPRHLQETQPPVFTMKEKQKAQLSLEVSESRMYVGESSEALPAGGRSAPLQTRSSMVTVSFDGNATPFSTEAPTRGRSSISVSRSSDAPVKADSGISVERSAPGRADSQVSVEPAAADDRQSSTSSEEEEEEVEVEVEHGGNLEESFVDLDISRNDPSLAGMHGMGTAQPSMRAAYLPDDVGGDAQIPGASEDDELSTQQDVNKLIAELSESSSASSEEGSNGDEALLAGLGLADGDGDEGDWV